MTWIYFRKPQTVEHKERERKLRHTNKWALLLFEKLVLIHTRHAPCSCTRLPAYVSGALNCRWDVRRRSSCGRGTSQDLHWPLSKPSFRQGVLHVPLITHTASGHETAHCVSHPSDPIPANKEIQLDLIYRFTLIWRSMCDSYRMRGAAPSPATAPCCSSCTVPCPLESMICAMFFLDVAAQPWSVFTRFRGAPWRTIPWISSRCWLCVLKVTFICQYDNKRNNRETHHSN
jgi:hypothetical protein